MYISKQEETLLSYLVGLAPMGQMFYASEEQLMQDLGDICSKHRTHISHLLTSLCEAGAIKRVFSKGYYITCRRPEEFRITWKGKLLTHSGETLQ